VRKQYNGAFNASELGTKISVYFDSINKFGEMYDEYLVGFDALVAKLNERGLRLLDQEECAKLRLSRDQSTGTFGELFEDMKDYYKNIPKEPKIESALSMSDDEKKLSFCNRWFIFRKDPTMLHTKVSKTRIVKRVPKPDVENDPDSPPENTKTNKRTTKKVIEDKDKDKVLEEPREKTSKTTKPKKKSTDVVDGEIPLTKRNGKTENKSVGNLDESESKPNAKRVVKKKALENEENNDDKAKADGVDKKGAKKPTKRVVKRIGGVDE
jgi:hypothetical protein